MLKDMQAGCLTRARRLRAVPQHSMARPRKVPDEAPYTKKYAHNDWFHIGNVGCSIFGFTKNSGDGLRYSYTLTGMYSDKDNKRQRTDFFPAGEGLTIKAVVDEAERRIERNKELHKTRAEVHGEPPQAAPEAQPAERNDAPVE